MIYNQSKVPKCHLNILKPSIANNWSVAEGNLGRSASGLAELSGIFSHSYARGILATTAKLSHELQFFFLLASEARPRYCADGGRHVLLSRMPAFGC